MSLGPNVGTAHITITPSLRGWSRHIQRQLNREVPGAAGNGSAAGDSAAQARAAERAGTRAGQRYAGGFDREVRGRIGKALEALPPIEVGAATSEAEQKFRDLRVQLAALGDQRIGVDVDTATALRRLEAFRAELTELALRSPDIQVQMDTLNAAAQLTAVRRQVENLERERATIQADADTGRAVVQLTFLQRLAQRVGRLRINLRARTDTNSANAALAGMSRRTRGLLTLIQFLGPALIPIGAVLLSLASSFAAAFTAAAAGVGVLLAAVLGNILPVLKAQEELEQKQDAAATAGQAYAAAQQQVASASRAVADAQRSAARSVADAERALVEARQSGARSIADAERAVADARRSAAQQVASAEDAVASAQDQARDAQDTLNDARDAAREKLAAYRDQLKGAALDEAGAALSVTAAREALNAALLDPASSQLDIDQAQQALQEAEFAYDQAGKRGRDLKAQARKDRAAGVDGDTAVVDAQQQLTAAQEGLAAAEASLGEARADAARSVAEAERSAAQARADAAAQVADAQRSLSRARVDGARAVVDAERQLAQARVAAADAAAADAKARGELGETMGKLTGPAAVFVKALDRAKAAWSSFTDATSKASFDVGAKGLDLFTDLLPNLVPLANKSARAVGVLFDDLRKFGEGPEGRRFLGWLEDRAPKAIKAFGRSIGNIVKGLGYLVGATAKNDTGFLKMTRRFSAWAKDLDKSPALKRFRAYVEEMGPKVGAALGAIVDAFANIVTAYAPVGAVVLGGITLIAKAIASIDPEIITAVAAGFLTFRSAMIVSKIAMAAFNTVAAANPFTLIVLAIAALVAGVVLAYRRFEGFRNFIDKAFADIKRIALDLWRNGIRPAFRAIAEFTTKLWKQHIKPAFTQIGRIIVGAWEKVIRPALKGLWTFITKVLVPVVKFLWQRVIKPYFEFMGAAIRFVWSKVIQPALKAMWWYISKVLVPIVKFLWDKIIKPYFKLIGAGIKFAWEKVIRPAVRAIGDFFENVLVPAFGRLKDFVTDRLVPALRRGFGVIGTIFDNLKKAAGTPVKFIVDTVYNKGIRYVINAIPGVGDLDAIDTSSWPAFAKGGPVRGGVRGRDSVMAKLMPDEHVWTTREVEAAGGHQAMFGLRALARAGQLGQVGQVGRGGAGGRRGQGGNVIWPLPGATASTYSGHDGVDLNKADDLGAPFYAAAAGQVTTTGYSRGYGNAVFIRGPYGELVYGHALDGSIQVSPGQSVAAGQWLANVGSTGRSSGPHLHFGFPGGTYGSAMSFLSGAGAVPAEVGRLKKNKGILARFKDAIAAVATFAKNVPGWLGNLTSPWGSLLKTGVGNLGNSLRSWVNGKIPGPGPLPDIFDRGGIATGAGYMRKATIRPERVLSPTQTELFARQVDTLEGFDDGMRRLASITGNSRGGSPLLIVRDFAITDWETGMAHMEIVAEDAAIGVYDDRAGHASRLAAGALV